MDRIRVAWRRPRGQPGSDQLGVGAARPVANGSDNQLYHRWYDGGWSGWQLTVTGVVTSAPAAVSWAPGRVDEFVRGADHGVWHHTGIG